MKFQNLILKAKKAYENKQLHDALEYYLEAEKMVIGCSSLLIDIALIYDELKDYDKAESYYEKVLSFDEENSAAYYGLATIFDNLKQYDKAIAFYKEAIELDKYYYQAHFFLANIYDMMKETNLSIYHYERVIEIKPDYFYAYLNLGSIYESLDQNKKALSLFKKAETLNTDNHLLYFNYGVVYRKLNLIDLSIDNYLLSIEKSKNYAYAFLNLAIIFKDDRKDYQKAIEIYTMGINYHPKSAVLYYNRGCCYALIKDYKRAIDDLNNAISINHSLFEYMIKDEELIDLRKSSIYLKTFKKN